jgi:hypothetical protein
MLVTIAEVPPKLTFVSLSMTKRCRRSPMPSVGASAYT